MEIIAILLALILATLLFGRDAVLGCFAGASVLLIGLAALAGVVGLAVILGVSAIETDTGRAVWRVVKEGAPYAITGAVVMVFTIVVARQMLPPLRRAAAYTRRKPWEAAARAGRAVRIAAVLPAFMVRAERRRVLEERKSGDVVVGPVSGAVRLVVAALIGRGWRPSGLGAVVGAAGERLEKPWRIGFRRRRLMEGGRCADIRGSGTWRIGCRG